MGAGKKEVWIDGAKENGRDYRMLWWEVMRNKYLNGEQNLGGRRRQREEGTDKGGQTARTKQGVTKWRWVGKDVLYKLIEKQKEEFETVYFFAMLSLPHSLQS